MKASRQRSKPLLSFLPLEDRITPATRMLPDLVPDAANLSGWTVSTSGGVTELAYSTGMQNLGKGAFELRGTSTIITNGDGSQGQVVNQRVYNDDSTFSDQQAGVFIYHPTHSHVHYDDFAWGHIRTRPTANWQDGVIVATGPKTSFCLLDLSRNHPELPGSPVNGVYNSCSSAVQGISVGWKDIYGSSLDGQQIDVSGLPNGDYWLEVVADPMNRVEETDDTNNTTRIPISLTSQPNNGLRILGATPVGGQTDSVGFVDVNFNVAINPGSFTSEDVNFSGPGGAIPVSSITQNSSVSYRVNFAVQQQVGTYHMTLGPNITGQTSGLPLNQDNDATHGEATDDVFINIFTIAAPRVTAHTPNGALAGPVSSLRVQYNKALVNNTFTMADIVSFTGPGGGDLMGQISGIAPVTTPNSAIFDISLSSPLSGLGAYSLVLEPNLTDTLGNSVDQNGDLVTDSLDRYTINFTLTPAAVAGPDAFGYTGLNASYEDLSGLTTGWTTIVNSADDSSALISLGTNTFNLYGVEYTGNTTMRVNTNGLITFGNSTTAQAYENNDLSGITHNSTTVYSPAIAALWDDWIKGSGTPQVRGRFQDTTGDSVPDRYIAQWNQTYHYGTTSGGATFSAILQLNTGVTPGDITFNYADLDTGNVSYNNGASATVGVRANGQGASRLAIAQNSGSNALVGSGKSVNVSVPKVVSIARSGPANSSAGDVDFLVTFSEGVTGLDPDDFTLASTGTISGALVDHIHSSADPRVYEVHVKTGVGAGTLGINLVDNDTIVSLLGAKLGGLGMINGDFARGAAYTIFQPAPQVQGINIGDGTAQRSMVRQAHVVFGWPVVFAGNPADAFVLTGPNGNVAVNVDLSAGGPDSTVARLTFSGSGTQHGSLADGTYTLTVLSSQVSTGGVALDGDADGNAGGNYTAEIKRLFGDSNGDGTIDGANFADFGTAFGLTQTNNAFDFNTDGFVDGLDFAEFGNRWGLTI